MAVKRIVIDAGHGGNNAPGAVNGHYQERHAALAIAKKLETLLKSKGHKVRMTRSNDEYLTLQERCTISNEYGADIFVSIHLNAAGNKDASGIETWRYKNVGSFTKRLASSVQSELIAATGARNRGVKETQLFYVLKHTVAPAILIETGFISNALECTKLFADGYQDKLAKAIANGIEKAIG